ncbi:MAG: hypothetical protein ILA26_06095 [Methanobrevibacter sp.]|uniref:hypothetical protein n=1 Tax=Methanobrevibacter sp. TaxID=66852 RepID=UPI001B74213B|nr:hypothetical protein [Methanobrevibacter sp.]MBP3791581.1 hypothetical protein [Methanobrevibacter sp.]
MHIDKKFFIILIIFLFVNIAAVSADDLNSTEIVELDHDGSADLEAEDIADEGVDEVNSSVLEPIEKTTPKISIESKKVNCKDTLEIQLTNSSGDALKSKKIIASINDKKYPLTTNSKGIAKLTIDLPAKTYKLTMSFEGDDNYTPVSKSFNIKVVKLQTKITESANFAVKGNYLYFSLADSNGNRLANKKMTIKFNGKTYTKKTNQYGTAKLKIKSSNSKYSIKAKFKGDNKHKSSSRSLKIHVISSRSIKIENTKVLTNGFIRVYLKVAGKAVSKKVTLTIGNKKLSKKANSEGIAVFKPQVKAGFYTVKAKVGKYYSQKILMCYEGNVKDPLKEKVALKNGVPDVDLMPGNYVTGDGNAKYTLKKSQYKDVLKRDSYCLFLNNKLTKYTFFKTKSHPNLNHIISREKWNVIERAINTKLVKKNKNGYWPGKITVSLKGKSYTYPEVRDVQGTGYTCGPTSASVCSQVLKNYFCERYLAKISGTDSTGTSCPNMVAALQKNNFKCSYFYKSTFTSALNELKKGGAALIFHANNHYVSILDISGDGKKVLVSNSYGTYDNIPTKWVKVSYMKNRFSPKWDESLIVRLNYNLPDAVKDSVNSYYSSFGTNWLKHSTGQGIGRV